MNYINLTTHQKNIKKLTYKKETKTQFRERKNYVLKSQVFQ